jgi:hypothetical protein
MLLLSTLTRQALIFQPSLAIPFHALAALPRQALIF